MNDIPGDDDPRPASGRSVLLRDIAALQVKLLVDGFRDLLLVPASLIVGLVSYFRGGPRVGAEFYDLLRLGRESERWINLFGALDRQEERPGGDSEPGKGEDIDRLVERVEAFVVDEYRHGHLTGPAREQLDRAVERLRQAAGRRRGGQ